MGCENVQRTEKYGTLSRAKNIVLSYFHTFWILEPSTKNKISHTSDNTSDNTSFLPFLTADRCFVGFYSVVVEPFPIFSRQGG